MAVNQQQLDYLSAIGIPVWVSRDLLMPGHSSAQERRIDLASAEGRLPAEFSGEAISIVSQSSSEVPASQAASALGAKKGLQAASELINDLQQAPVKQIAALAASLDEGDEVVPPVIRRNLEGVGWAELEKSVSQCTACDLHAKRQSPVFGYGSQQPSLMVVGDIPRLSDEQQNQPFTGEVGELLSSMLSHLDVSMEAIYFTNLLKCRTPLDGSPQSNQAASCLSYLKQQIKLLRPPLVLLMGRSTVQQTLGQDKPMAQLRGKLHQLEGFDCRFVATYHPAYLLKQPRLKAPVWKDLQLTKEVLSNNG